MATVSPSTPSTSNTNTPATTVTVPPAAVLATGPNQLSTSPSSEKNSSSRPRQLPPPVTGSDSPASTITPLPSRSGSPQTADKLHQHASSPSTSSLSKAQKPIGIFALAAAAFDKTQSAFVGSSTEAKVRPRLSLSRLSFGLESQLNLDLAGPEKNPRSRPASNYVGTPPADSRASYFKATARDPPSQPYSETDPSRPPPIILPRVNNKMHQTSSRLLRMTDEDRPFTKDFKDLFSTLIVSLLPLSAHRVRLTKVEHTFLSEDAINNLGSLKFSQSNRMPDPKDPSRIVTTTTTTTFSMAKDMARSICQRFLDARFIESADGKYQQVYTLKGSVWQLTPKGITVLDRFCSRNGIQQKHVSDLIGSQTTQLVILERITQSDKLISDRGTLEVIFRRFVGANGPNVKSSISTADSDSLSDYRDGLTGVKMASERKIAGKTFKDTFTGKAATDWLLDCCTTVDRRETFEMASLFIEYELMESVQHDRTYMAQYSNSNLFQPTKNAIYQLTARGKDVVSGALGRGRSSESEGVTPARPGVARDSNTQRLDKILTDAALRLLFRENLRETHCEENLSFYLEVEEFIAACRAATRLAQKSPGSNSMDGIKEIMAQAYGIYNAFLAPGSPCELNIDHQLRNNLATRMTKAVGQDVAMIDTLHEVTALFEDAQNAVFKLMASDSVPKFLRSPKYESTLRHYDFDSIAASNNQAQAPAPARVPERSQSRSNRK